MTTPILGSETSINIPDAAGHSHVQGRRWSNGMVRDSTLTEVQRNFVKRTVLASFVGGAFSVGIMTLALSSRETYSFASVGASGLMMCCVMTFFAAALQQVFRDLNQRQNVTAPTESSPILDEV
ncbi:MAG: hypothetical protein ACRDDW_06500 [Candidatus Rhabdochlamydia sp.]